MRRLHLSAEAAADLDEIWFAIAKRNPAAADRIVERIHEVANTLLLDFPESGHTREELDIDLRSFAVEKHLIFYKIVDDGIEIVRVLYGPRDLFALFAPTD